MAVGEVALRLAQIAMGPPAGRVTDMGGPEIRTMSELAGMYLVSADRKKKIVTVPFPGKFAAGLRKGYGMTPDHGDGIQTFSEFLELGPGQR